MSLSFRSSSFGGAIAVAAVLLATSFSVCLALAAAADKENEAKISKEEQYLVDLTNAERAKLKLPALKVHPLLNKAAVIYSKVMIKHDKKAQEMMKKKDPKVHEIEGINVDKRLDAIRYNYTEYGENVAITFSLDEVTRMKPIHKIWMDSKVHRDNILEKAFKEIGIAVVKHPDRNEWYVTQIFGTR